MSDQKPHATDAPSKPEASINHLNSARYARLLFGQGEAGWQQNMAGQYLRRVEPMEGQAYTKQDYERCFELLRYEFGIQDVEGSFQPNQMLFCIYAEDMALLRQDGIGKTNAGKLLSFDKPIIADDNNVAQANDPMAVLRENLRMAVHDLHAWKEPKSHKFAKGDLRESEVILPKAFLQQLACVLPEHHGFDYELKDAVRDMLIELLPGIPVNVSLFGDGMLTLSVQPEYYSRLEDAIMQAKQQPSTNVTSIEPAREKRTARLER